MADLNEKLAGFFFPNGIPNKSLITCRTERYVLQSSNTANYFSPPLANLEFVKVVQNFPGKLLAVG